MQIPKPLHHFDEPWQSVQLSGPFKALILCDLHIPYHDPTAIQAAVKEGIRQRCDVVLLNGDVWDALPLSDWVKDPRKRGKLKEELASVKQFLSWLRERMPAARLLFKLGNHEERWERFLFRRAQELVGVPDFEIPALLKLSDVGCEHVIGDMRPIRMGDLNVVHGHEYRFSISNPVNPARGLFLRAKAYALCGHFHQSSYHTEKCIDGENMATWSVGCLCDLHPDYRPLNNWSQGFAIVEVEQSGKFHVQNKYVSKGKVY